MLEAGRLRHRVVIQKPVLTQDVDTGAMDTTWQDVATVWAAIEPLSVREMIAAQAEDSKVSARITIRYRNDLDHTCRLYHAAKKALYNVEGIMADKDSGLEYITVPVSEGLKYCPGTAAIPVILTAPVVSGTPQVGQILTATQGLWANNPDGYEYQWYLDNSPIPSETDLTITVPNDIGGVLKFVAKASNMAGTSLEATSNQVSII